MLDAYGDKDLATRQHAAAYAYSQRERMSKCPPLFAEILKVAQREIHPYAVIAGGAVRDYLLTGDPHTCKDIDIFVPLSLTSYIMRMARTSVGGVSNFRLGHDFYIGAGTNYPRALGRKQPISFVASTTPRALSPDFHSPTNEVFAFVKARPDASGETPLYTSGPVQIIGLNPKVVACSDQREFGEAVVDAFDLNICMSWTDGEKIYDRMPALMDRMRGEVTYRGPAYSPLHIAARHHAKQSMTRKNGAALAPAFAYRLVHPNGARVTDAEIDTARAEYEATQLEALF